MRLPGGAKDAHAWGALSLFERDYFKRLVEQLARALAAIRRTGSGGPTDAGLEIVRESCRDVLGVPYEMLQSIDPASAALLLNDAKLSQPIKVSGYARLLEAQAELHMERGEETEAELSMNRALALYIESLLIDPAHDEGLAGLERMRTKTDTRRLGERYREFLAELDSKVPAWTDA
jgi:hypothetical protein